MSIVYTDGDWCDLESHIPLVDLRFGYCMDGVWFFGLNSSEMVGPDELSRNEVARRSRVHNGGGCHIDIPRPQSYTYGEWG